MLANDTVEVVEVTTAMDTIGFSQERVTNGGGKEFMNSQTKQKYKTGTKNEGGAEDSTKRQPERHSLKRGRKRTINLNTVFQVHGEQYLLGAISLLVFLRLNFPIAMFKLSSF